MTTVLKTTCPTCSFARTFRWEIADAPEAYGFRVEHADSAAHVYQFGDGPRRVILDENHETLLVAA